MRSYTALPLGGPMDRPDPSARLGEGRSLFHRPHRYRNNHVSGRAEAKRGGGIARRTTATTWYGSEMEIRRALRLGLHGLLFPLAILMSVGCESSSTADGEGRRSERAGRRRE